MSSPRSHTNALMSVTRSFIKPTFCLFHKNKAAAAPLCTSSCPFNLPPSIFHGHPMSRHGAQTGAFSGASLGFPHSQELALTQSGCPSCRCTQMCHTSKHSHTPIMHTLALSPAVPTVRQRAWRMGGGGAAACDAAIGGVSRSCGFCCFH